MKIEEALYRKYDLGYKWSECFYKKHLIPIEFEYFIDDFVTYCRFSLKHYFEVKYNINERALDIFLSRTKKRKFEGRQTFKSLAQKHNISDSRVQSIYIKTFRYFRDFLQIEGILK